MDSNNLADDLLEGRKAIATFLYGRADRKTLRRVDHLITTGRIPAGKLGDTVFSYKSRIKSVLDQSFDEAAA